MNGLLHSFLKVNNGFYHFDRLHHNELIFISIHFLTFVSIHFLIHQNSNMSISNNPPMFHGNMLDKENSNENTHPRFVDSNTNQSCQIVWEDVLFCGYCKAHGEVKKYSFKSMHNHWQWRRKCWWNALIAWRRNMFLAKCWKHRKWKSKQLK